MKTKLLSKLMAAAVFIAFAFTSCVEEEDGAASSASFTCKIDGETFVATSFENTLIGDESGKRLDIRGTDASGRQLHVAVSDNEPLGTAFSQVGNKIYIDGFQNTPSTIRTLGTLIFPDDSFAMTIGDGKEAGYAIVTSFEPSNRKVSGGFEFFVKNLLTEEMYHVTEGKFENMTFIQMEIDS